MRVHKSTYDAVQFAVSKHDKWERGEGHRWVDRQAGECYPSRGGWWLETFLQGVLLSWAEDYV